MKKYKPGQFVSIGGKLARVYMASHYVHATCVVCANKNGCNDPCGIHASECIEKLNTDLYPKFIK